MTRILIMLCALLFSLDPTCLAQLTKDQIKADEKGDKAVKLSDEGKFDHAISLLKEAHKLDPESMRYRYELGYCFYHKKDYPTALKYFNDILYHKDAGTRVYQMLGNVYDDMGDSVNALKSYTMGLQKYPNSGGLYTEMGTYYLKKEEYNKGLGFYEKGIEMAPMYASNYFRAAQIYLMMTEEEVWGMLYGEIFMNLERNTQRTAEMSNMLYKTYKSEIKWENDTSMTISFSKAGNYIDANSTKLPFSTSIYELTMIHGAKNPMDYEAMCDMRKTFIEEYFKENKHKEYYVALFDYNYKALKSGHFDAYNHWVLSQGDKNAFDKWKKSHGEEFERFVQWFKENPLELDEKNVVLRKNLGG